MNLSDRWQHLEHQQGIGLAIMAVAFFSTSPVFIRWAAPLSASEITAWRMLIGAFSVGLLALGSRQSLRLPVSHWRKFVLFGLIAAVHFLAYNAALSYTTIAHALTILYTAPAFVALLSAAVLGESLSRRKWLGIAVVVAGIAVLAGFEPRLTPRMLLGNGLALLSAVMLALYSVVGRSQRTRYPLLTYAFGVYLIAALWTAPVALVDFTPDGYGRRQVFSLLGLGVLPLGLGHTLYNAAVRRIQATYANLITSQEVTGGILLGALLLGEIPGPTAIGGVGMTLAGIALVLM
ncbi:MAG: DMT family transporter [Anaerolineae bacterium]